MKFCWCTINVINMEESLQFYKEVVGLSLERRFQAGPDTEIAFLGTGGTEIELIWNRSKESVTIGNDISLGFEVDSLKEKIAFLKERKLDFTGPFQPNPHVKFIFVTDPNGCRIQFVESM